MLYIYVYLPTTFDSEDMVIIAWIYTTCGLALKQRQTYICKPHDARVTFQQQMRFDWKNVSQTTLLASKLQTT